MNFKRKIIQVNFIGFIERQQSQIVNRKFENEILIIFCSESKCQSTLMTSLRNSFIPWKCSSKSRLMLSIVTSKIGSTKERDRTENYMFFFWVNEMNARKSMHFHCISKWHLLSDRMATRTAKNSFFFFLRFILSMKCRWYDVIYVLVSVENWTISESKAGRNYK